jgi:NDP-sugar pyrophosphorylase family protein
MKAMVLAAGLGTRLRPLTETRPKALVELNGRTLLEITLTRLRSFGVKDVIVNVHHFAGMMVDYLRSHANFGMNIQISREDILLDTGGGLKKAAWFFLEGRGAAEPFFLHNVDVISDIDLKQMLDAHSRSGALATLAVQNRETSRYLLFDEQLHLCGRRSSKGDEIARQASSSRPLAFAGIHVISPRLLTEINEDGAFSMIDIYLRLAKEREQISGFPADQYYWRDLGKHKDLEQAERELRGDRARP